MGYEWTLVGPRRGVHGERGRLQGSSEALSVTNLNSVITSGAP